MKCVFRTNPVQKVQDDYLWYHLDAHSWIKGPKSGLSPDIPIAADLSKGFSSIRIGSSFMVLFRDKESGPLALAVDVLTARTEVGQHHRPITDAMCLLAENASDAAALFGFATACLNANDAKGLGDPTSEIGAAVDDIWKTASLDAFVAMFRGRSIPQNDGKTLDASWRYPRNDAANRREIAALLPSLFGSSRPFLVALTDRSPNEAMRAIPAFNGTYCIFSSRVENAEKVVRSDFLLTPSMNRTGMRHKLVAGVVAAAVLLVLIKACSGPSPKLAVELQPKAANSCTNLPVVVRPSCSTNSVNSSESDANVQKVAGPEIEAGN